MNDYDGAVVDQYMRSVLEQDLSPIEVDNSLTILSTLLSVSPGYFPPGRTFIRIDRQSLKFHPEIVRTRGIRIVVFKDGEEQRTMYIPRHNLTDLETAMDAMFFVLKNGHLMSEDDYEA